MSVGRFQRALKEAFGEPPYSWLMTRRVERAMSLLRLGDASVTEVCTAVGCTSLGSFSSRFTDLVAMTPREYHALITPSWSAYPGASPSRSHPSTTAIGAKRSFSESAREHDREVGVRCGGHSIVGHAVPDDGMVIDLRPMGGVRVDPEPNDLERLQEDQAVEFEPIDQRPASRSLRSNEPLE